MKNFLQRYLPDAAEVKQNRTLRWFGSHIHDPNLWHLTRRSVPGAFAIGLFCSFIPSPGQMLIAAALAVFLRKNVPLAFALVWISNPVTIPPIFYMAYRVGAWILGIEPLGFEYMANLLEQVFAMELDWDQLWQVIAINWKPLLLGSAICGSIAAALSYFFIMLLWRMNTARKWRRRKLKQNH